MIDDQEFDRSSGGFELETELLLEGVEYGQSGGVGRGCAGDLVNELETDVECARQVCPVEDGLVQSDGEDPDEL